MRLEVAVIPVTDVSRALHFYRSLGWRLDADFEASPRFRLVQLTPPGSECSIHSAAGSPRGAGLRPQLPCGLRLEQACADLISRGVEVSEIYHNVYDAGVQDQADGPDPEGRSYASFASFSDATATGGCCKRSRCDYRGGDE